jgi:uncharacterized protein YdhG (YjbR/CyaY superfamily)
VAKTDFKSVDEYLATLPVDVQKVLERARAIVKKALPAAEEVISYQIPAYKLSGRAVLYLAGWKEHLSLYPITPALSEALGEALAPHVAGRGTLRFALSEPLPVKLIERIAKLRAQETLELVASKAKRPAQARATKAKASPRRAQKKVSTKKVVKKRRRALSP